MKIAQRTSGLLRETHYPEALSRRCIHGLLLLGWLLMVLAGTTLLGVSTSNHSAQFPFCLDSESFCSQNVLFNTSATYHFYIKLSGFHQNNRMSLSPHPGSWIV